MPVIKVWCLPQVPEEQLRKLHRDIVAAVVSVKELGLKDETEMTCLFPPDMDMMHYGLGEEIIIEVSGLFEKPDRTKAVRQALAEALGKVARAMFPDAHVECFISSFNPAQGFWTNR